LLDPDEEEVDEDDRPEPLPEDDPKDPEAPLLEALANAPVLTETLPPLALDPELPATEPALDKATEALEALEALEPDDAAAPLVLLEDAPRELDDALDPPTDAPEEDPELDEATEALDPVAVAVDDVEVPEHAEAASANVTQIGRGFIALLGVT
jgi:hypothetical protein